MFTDTAAKFAAIALTIVMSATCMLGALAPGMTGTLPAQTQIVA